MLRREKLRRYVINPKCLLFSGGYSPKSNIEEYEEEKNKKLL